MAPRKFIDGSKKVKLSDNLIQEFLEQNNKDLSHINSFFNENLIKNDYLNLDYSYKRLFDN
jgi:hypothetical protein